MQSPDWDNVMGAWVLDGKSNRLIRLDGTSPTIHSLNVKHRTELTSELALSYLGFFCTFVHASDEGMFGLVDTGHEAILPTNWPNDELEKYLKPTSLIAEDEQGFRVEASVFHSNSLSWAHFLVHRDGRCEMLDDEPMATDVSARILLRLKHKIEPDDVEPKEKQETKQIH